MKLQNEKRKRERKVQDKDLTEKREKKKKNKRIKYCRKGQETKDDHENLI